MNEYTDADRRFDAMVEKNNLQEKINTWWAGLPLLLRQAWWSEYDVALCEGETFLVYWVLPISRELQCMTSGIKNFPMDDCTPAPCPQFWWKLEDHIEEDLYFIRPPVKSVPVGWMYSTRAGLTTHKDRGHALLDAVLAVQGEGE